MFNSTGRWGIMQVHSFDGSAAGGGITGQRFGSRLDAEVACVRHTARCVSSSLDAVIVELFPGMEDERETQAASGI